MSIYLPNRKNRLKTENKDIFSKNKIALQGIERLQDENRLTLVRDPNRFMRDLDEDFSKILTHKQLKQGKNEVIQIFPYHEQFFSIDAAHLLFPIRIFLKNVRNQSTLYIGYDKKFPGVKKSAQALKKNQEEEEEKSYDLKYTINNDILIELLGNKKKNSIKKIYLTFIAHRHMFMFNVHFDHIGFDGYQEYLETKKKVQDSKLRRVKTEKEESSKKDQGRNHQKNSSELPEIFRKGSYEQKKEINTEQLSIEKHNHRRSLSKESLKNFIRANCSRVGNFNREHSKSQKILKKEHNLQKSKRIIINAKNQEMLREKQLTLKNMAAVFRQEIELYQNFYMKRKVQNAKTCHQILTFVYLTNFAKKSHEIVQKQNRKAQSEFIVKYFVNKFSKKFNRNHRQNTSLIPSFKIRNHMSVYHMIQLQAKCLKSNSEKKCAEVLFKAFLSVKIGLQINQVFQRSVKYRRAIRLIQRRWIFRYKARMMMLQNFGYRHSKRMLKDFPHLKVALQIFNEGNHCHKVCYNYLMDESIKFRLIYDAYRKRVQEIEDFIEENKKIKEYNKGKALKKWKKYLQIPQKPYPPQQRVFRNLDILKSMLRGWFELEYKKIIKKNNRKY